MSDKMMMMKKMTMKKERRPKELMMKNKMMHESMGMEERMTHHKKIIFLRNVKTGTEIPAISLCLHVGQCEEREEEGAADHVGVGVAPPGVILICLPDIIYVIYFVYLFNNSLNARNCKLKHYS